MEKITLNFYGEELSTNTPKNLSDLRAKISSLFLLNENDTLQLILTYNDINSKISNIENDSNYNMFLSKKISKIYINISKNSNIYKNQISKQEEIEKDNKELQKLLELDIEMDKPTNNKFKAEQDELKEINEKISELIKRKNVLIKKIHSSVNERNNKHLEVRKKIVELQEKLGLPPKYNFVKRVGPFRVRAKPNEKNIKTTNISKINKEVKDKKDINSSKDKPLEKESKNDLNEISSQTTDKSSSFQNKNEINSKSINEKDEKNIFHIANVCNECINPIDGIIFKCVVCDNFHFCEKCEEKFGFQHGHPLLKIKNPKEASFLFKFEK